MRSVASRARSRRALKKWYASLTKDERQALVERLKQARRKKYEEDPAAREQWIRKNSESKRAFFTSPQARANVGKHVKRWYANLSPEEIEADRQDRSERFKRMWAARSPERRAELRATSSTSLTEWWANASPEAYADRARKSRLSRPTKPELQMTALLSILSIDFRFQYPVGRYCVDFFIPSHNLVIEVDGEYWHNRPGNKAADRKRDRTLRKLGYTVFRVWAKQVSAPRTRARLLKLVVA